MTDLCLILGIPYGTSALPSVILECTGMSNSWVLPVVGHTLSHGKKKLGDQKERQREWEKETKRSDKSFFLLDWLSHHHTPYSWFHRVFLLRACGNSRRCWKVAISHLKLSQGVRSFWQSNPIFRSFLMHSSPPGSAISRCPYLFFPFSNLVSKQIWTNTESDFLFRPWAMWAADVNLSNSFLPVRKLWEQYMSVGRFFLLGHCPSVHTRSISSRACLLRSQLPRVLLPNRGRKILLMGLIPGHLLRCKWSYPDVTPIEWYGSQMSNEMLIGILRRKRILRLH